MSLVHCVWAEFPQLLSPLVFSDGVHQFEIRMKKFMHQLEEGVEVVMWQLNRSAEQATPEDEFSLKASHVTVKMQRKGDLYLQSVLNFILRGGYLSKAIGRNRGGKIIISLWKFLLFCQSYRFWCKLTFLPLLATNFALS
jgi:hypothetical protein